MNEDDGKSRNSLKSKQYQLLNFSAQQNKDSSLNKLNIRLENTTPSQKYQGMPNQREIVLTIHNWQRGYGSITVNGNKFKSPIVYDKQNNQLKLKFYWLSKASDLTIEIQ